MAMSPRPLYDPTPRGLDDPTHYLSRTIDLLKADVIAAQARGGILTRAEIAHANNISIHDLNGFLNRNGIVTWE